MGKSKEAANPNRLFFLKLQPPWRRPAAPATTGIKSIYPLIAKLLIVGLLLGLYALPAFAQNPPSCWILSQSSGGYRYFLYQTTKPDNRNVYYYIVLTSRDKSTADEVAKKQWWYQRGGKYIGGYRTYNQAMSEAREKCPEPGKRN